MGLLSKRTPVPQPPQPPQPATEPLPIVGLWQDGLGRVATRSIQTIAVAAVVAMAIWAGTRLTLVIIPVLLALIFASAIHPFVSWMRRHGIPSPLATTAALLSILLILAGVVTLITWAVRNQWDDLVSSANEGVEELQRYVEDLPFGIDTAQLDSLKGSATDFLQSSQFSSGAVAGISATGNFLTGLLLMIVVLFFFLKDGPRIWEFLLRPFEGEQYERGRRIGTKAVQTLGGYVRGTATVAAVDAIGIGVGLAILGVPLALPLAVVVFLTAFIPLVGATLAGLLAALVALVANGPGTALIVVGIVVAVNQLEGNLLQPVVMGRSLKLHGLVILLALTAGTILGGVAGAVLAVPFAAVAWGIVLVWNGDSVPARPVQVKRREAV